MVSAAVLSIRFWMVVPVVATLVAASAAMLWLVDRRVEVFAERRSLDVLRAMAEGVRDHVDHGVEKHIKNLQLLVQAHDAGGGDRQRLLMQARGRFADVTAFTWANAQGIVVAQFRGRTLGDDVSSQAWFIAGRERPFLGEVGVSKAHGGTEFVVEVAVPEKDASGHTVAVLRTEFGVEWFRSLIAEVLDPARLEAASAEILLLDRESRVLIGPDGTVGKRMDEPGGGRAPYVSVAAGSRGRDLFESVGWVVVVRQASDTALAAHRQLRGELAALATLLLLSCLGIAAWLSSRLARPIEDTAAALFRAPLLPQAALSGPAGTRELRALFVEFGALQERQGRHDRTTAQEIEALELRLRESSASLLQVNGGLREAMERMASSEHMLRTVTDNLPVFILYIDRELRIRFSNATVSQWMSRSDDRLIGSKVGTDVPADIFGGSPEVLHRVLQGERLTLEVSCSLDGVVHDLQTVCIPDMHAETVEGMFVLATDVTAMKSVTRQLELLSRVDALTNLPNRRSLEEHASQALLRAKRGGHAMALLFLDIDRFKSINDTWGHGVGDQVIREFGQRVVRSVRATDFVARLAGDEFVALLEDVHAAHEAEAVAGKIAKAVAQPLMVEQLQLDISTSIGVVVHQGGNATLASMLHAADQALYAAKAAGRNRVCVRQM